MRGVLDVLSVERNAPLFSRVLSDLAFLFFRLTRSASSTDGTDVTESPPLDRFTLGLYGLKGFLFIMVVADMMKKQSQSLALCRRNTDDGRGEDQNGR
jgi:hypothetical protein